jgi:hypothetical protein
MNFRKWYLMSLLALFFAFSANAHISPLNNSPNNSTPNTGNSNPESVASFRNDCVKPVAQIDQNVNNVRARLTTGGDVWWDRSDGKYIVPKPLEAGDREVSSIFAGGVWLGGIQEGAYKVAAQQYGNAGADSRDFWTGPLNPSEDPVLRGTTADSICEQWDRFWVVTGPEIEEHLDTYNRAISTGTEYDPADIPLGVKGWPGKGNPFFVEINNFELPNTTQGLGAFWDEDGDEKYNPLMGDFPIIEIEGCVTPQFPDQMFFWIYNDAGNVHTESNGDKIKMEIQVQSFAYETNDALNDMTFQRYKLINRASLKIDSTFFAMWVDADLGCFTDDYIGCDTTRSLAYYYNVDAEDGDVGTQCGAVETYGTTIPALGIDYFRGPKEPIFDDMGNPVLDSLGEQLEVELGMSSFTYFNNPGEGPPPGAETDPNTVLEYYRYMSGLWRDGTPFTEGGNGYGGTTPVQYVFPDEPDDQAGWSMCTAAAANNPEYDRRTVQASGPFTLLPGAVNELIVGAVWVPDFDYPCPDMSRLFNADDLAQNLFNSCFDILDGPDAPDVDIIELDREVVLILTNDEFTSNNANELYTELDINAPGNEFYEFQGYIIYQLIDGFVSTGDYDNPDKARIIGQVDIKDGISTLYNWNALDDTPDFIGESIFTAVKEVEGADNGIRHTFVIDKDQFAGGNNATLINHKKYYFSAIAYGYNNWQNFDPSFGEGQAKPYVEGRRNINTYIGIPRPITDRNLNSAYGDGAQITRLDGVGNGGNFLDLTEETLDNIKNSSSFNSNGGRFDEPIVYKEGLGPIDVKVYNPLDVRDGEFKLDILDEDFGSDGDLKKWRMTSGSSVEVDSEKSIDALNEQIIGEYGFTVSIGQVSEPGAQLDDTNGAIGAVEEYADEDATPWYVGIPNLGGDLIGNSQFLSLGLNFAAAGDLNAEDPDGGLVNIGSGFFPYKLAEYRTGQVLYPFGNVSPAWQNNSNNLVRNTTSYADLNNVNIVFTSDKNLWSRCVIVETSTSPVLPAIGGAESLDPRQSPSVGLDDNDGDGLPDADNTGMGMGYFPGYAVDVETGQRLNIFFGENSSYDCTDNPSNCDFFTDGTPTGGDMMFNPTSQFFSPFTDATNPTAFNLVLGGQHFIYVTKQPYDECEAIAEALNGNSLARVNALKEVTWTGVPFLNPGATLKSYADGLIPADLTIKLRVNNAYDYMQGTEAEGGTNPAYEFAINGKQAGDLDAVGIESQLDEINIVPNPYYGFSDYDGNNTDNVVKITNLPAKCVVTIYTLDGKFIRRYDRDETGQAPVGSGIAKTQILPDIDWNMKNSKNIPIAGGVYLIHVDAEGLGERVLKWFGTNRALDPSNL